MTEQPIPDWIVALKRGQDRYDRAKAGLRSGEVALDDQIQELSAADAERVAAWGAGAAWQREMLARVPEIGAE